MLFNLLLIVSGRSGKRSGLLVCYPYVLRFFIFALPRSPQSSSLRSPATAETGREKQIAPASVPVPALPLTAFIMAAFSLALDTI